MGGIVIRIALNRWNDRLIRSKALARGSKGQAG